MKSLSQEERLVLFGKLSINENNELQHIATPIAHVGIADLLAEFEQLSYNLYQVIKIFGAIATRSKMPVIATTG